MTIVVVLLIVAVWAAVLGPSLWRRYADKRSTDSIGTFHRQLRVLHHAGPAVAGVHRIGTAQPSTGVAPGATGLPIVTSRPDDLPTTSGGSGGSDSPPRHRDPFFHPAACRRRRDTLVALTGTVAVTGLLGVLLAPMLIVCALSAVALASYLVMLVRLRTQAVERQVKLRYLPTPLEPQSSVQIRESVAR